MRTRPSGRLLAAPPASTRAPHAPCESLCAGTLGGRLASSTSGSLASLCSLTNKNSRGGRHLPIHSAADACKARAVWDMILRAAKRCGIEHECAMPSSHLSEAGKDFFVAQDSGVCASSCAIALSADDGPEWIELIPAGKFSAVDGRGPFLNDDAESVVAASIAKMPQVGLVLDYDHSTDLAAPEGRPAPAAGWLKQFKIERGAIFARIEWTDEAAAAVKEKKYRYVSPVFEHSKDGKLLCILRAALTNNPALINLPAIASARTQAASPPLPSPVSNNRGGDRTGQDRGANRDSLKPPHDQGEGRVGVSPGVARMAKEDGKPMKLSEVMAVLEEAYPDASADKLMKAAACLMGEDDDDEPDDEAAHAAEGDPYENEDADRMAARQAEEKAEMAKQHAEQKDRFAKRMARQNKGLEAQNRNEKISQRSLARSFAGEGRVRVQTLSEAVARHPMVLKMATDLNQMRATQAKACATEKVDQAIRDGRLVPSQRDWAIEYCSADFQGFEKFVGAQPKILQAGPDGTFTARIGDAPADALTQKELMVAENLGVSPEKFAAAKKARLSHNVHLD